MVGAIPYWFKQIPTWNKERTTSMTKITAKFKDGLWIVSWRNPGNDLRPFPRAFRSAAELQAWADAHLAPHAITEV
jgi:hypothetical protein